MRSTELESAASESSPSNRASSWLNNNAESILAVAIVFVWAVLIGRAYLNLDPRVVPAGREFGSAVQAHHLWTRFAHCGPCAMWDGSERGGFPALADTLASSLHPLVMVTTLALGVVNGAKIALIVSFGIAGLAQLWLGAELKLGWAARIWGALMVMVGGHLGAKMELGLFSIVLSTAMFSLTLPAALRLAQTGRYRDSVLFAVILALFAVSGQGYMQVGFLQMSPAYLVLLIGTNIETGLLLRRFLLAAGLALLLASPFLVPLVHFWPNLVKDGDPTLGAAQPLAYYALNLFIDDFDFLNSTALGKLPFPHLYTMYVGWIPFILAMLCLRYARRSDLRPLLFLAFSASLAIFAGSMISLKWVQPLIPAVSMLRFSPMIGALAVPPLIGLAAYGLDGLLRQRWPRPDISLGNGGQASVRFGLDLRWLLIVPLSFALFKGYQFGQNWLFASELKEEIGLVLQNLETPSLVWVQPPFGEHAFIEPAVGSGLKLSPGVMTWRWKGREFPEPLLEANRQGPPPNTLESRPVGDVTVYVRNVPPYAAVYSDNGSETCIAQGSGGDLTVQCDTANGGTLVVRENQWSGWHARLDGEPVALDRSGPWLAVRTPAGEHTHTFRYRPWDVPAGLGLFVAGVAACIYFWRKPDSMPEVATSTV